MSQDIQQPKSSFGSTVASYGIMPGVYGTCIGISALKNGKGIKGAIENMNIEGYKNLNNTMKDAGVDVFTRSSAISRGHDAYKSAVKGKVKAETKLKKLKNASDLPLKEKFLNIFRKQENKVTPKGLQEAAQENLATASSRLQTAQDAITNGAKNFDPKSAAALDEVLETGEQFANIAGNIGKGVKKGFGQTVKGFGRTVKGNFIKEIGFKKGCGGKFNALMTAIQFVPNVINEVIPAFKNEGFKAGMKATGKTIARGFADFFGYAAGGAIGRTIGAAIGSCICPGAGTAVGALMGDLVCSMVVGGATTKTVDKIIEKKEEKENKIQEQTEVETGTETIASESITETPSNDNIVINSEIKTNEELAANETKKLDITDEASQVHQPMSFEEAKLKATGMTNSFIANEQKTKSRYKRPVNGVYHTAWVNQLNQQNQQKQQGLNLQA